MRSGTATNLRIRQEALRLLVEKGVDAVSVRDIADAVGIRPSTLYVHWKSRHDLILDLYVTGYTEYGRRVTEAASSPGSFQTRIEAVIRLICRLHGEDETLFKFLLLTQHEHLLHIPDEENTPIEVLQHMVTSAMAAGEIPPSDPALVTAALVGIVLQAATFQIYGRLPRKLDEIANEIVGLCLKIVRP
jgi:AcrR family transcriptional regulator